MTDTTRTENSTAFTLTAAKRAERKSTGLLECVIISLAGLAVTILAIAHGLPTALQITAMQ